MSSNKINDFMEDLGTARSSFMIDEETFHRWEQSQVTKKLFVTLNEELIEKLINENSGNFSSIETIALRAAYLRGVQETIEYVLDWNPLEKD